MYVITPSDLSKRFLEHFLVSRRPTRIKGSGTARLYKHTIAITTVEGPATQKWVLQQAGWQTKCRWIKFLKFSTGYYIINYSDFDFIAVVIMLLSTHFNRLFSTLRCVLKHFKIIAIFSCQPLSSVLSTYSYDKLSYNVTQLITVYLCR